MGSVPEATASLGETVQQMLPTMFIMSIETPLKILVFGR